MSDWIKCDDDLPKQNGMFLVTAESTWTKERSVGLGKYSSKDEDFITKDHWLDFEIVAWQEIPPPFVEAAPEQIALENRIALEIREAVNAEREACANLAEQLSTDTDLYPNPDACGARIFNAIRRR